VPIPGTKRRKYLEENLAAAALPLSLAELSRITAFLGEFRTSGNRYSDAGLALVRG
jgi:aryl-alcohol dehydrogenase-like predicted oxidoreductase